MAHFVPAMIIAFGLFAGVRSAIKDSVLMAILSAAMVAGGIVEFLAK